MVARSSYISSMLTRLIYQCRKKGDSYQRQILNLHKAQSYKEKEINNYKRSKTAEIKYESNNSDLMTQVLNNLDYKGGNSTDALNSFYQQNGIMISQEYAKLQANQSNIQQIRLNELEDYIEAWQEAELEPLKDEEEDLQVQKENNETRLKMYEQWKQAAQEETQSSIKNFKPLGSGSSYG